MTASTTEAHTTESVSPLYDDEVFFSRYAEMSRSRDGLAGAAEWPTLREVLPDVRGKQVLDAGCGYGWHAAWFQEAGAASVLATDVSEKMLDVARARHAYPNVRYVQADLGVSADLDAIFGEGPFDLVLASLVLHYLDDYAGFARRVFDALRPGGSFVFNVEHPVFTAEGSQNWLTDDEGRIRCFPVDRYAEEGPREAEFLGCRTRKVHRTLETYLQTLLKLGFVLRAVREPKPTAEALAQVPELRDELRRPMMFIVWAEKLAGG